MRKVALQPWLGSAKETMCDESYFYCSLFTGQAAASPDLPLLIITGTSSVPKYRENECGGGPNTPAPARSHALGWVKALQKLLLVDFSHLVAWDLLHHDQLGRDGVRCHGVPATQRHSPLQPTDPCFQPLHPTESIPRPRKHCRTWGGGICSGPLQPVAVYNRAPPAVALRAAGPQASGFGQMQPVPWLAPLGSVRPPGERRG